MRTSPDNPSPERSVPFRSPHELAGLPPESGLLLGLSGGADSVLLFRLLVRETEKTGARLVCLHVHHGIRGEEADKDEAFCRSLCESYAVPFLSRRINVPALAKERGESEETVGRSERYRLFSEVMAEKELPILCLAHHADDRAETSLFNLLRGCGTAGIAGMPVCRKIAGGTLVRPLAGARKQEILDCLAAIGQPWREDATNAEESYTRNRIRHTVIPALASVSGDPVPALLRLSESAREDDEALTELARALLGGRNRLPLDEIASSPRAVASRAVRILYGTLRERAVADPFGERSLSRRQTEDVLSLARAGIPHSSLSLPDGITARIEEGTLFFATPDDRPAFLPYGVPTVTEETYRGEEPSDRDFFVRSLAVRGKITVRHRLPGDTVDLGTHRKSLHKWFGERKIDLALRDELPLLCDDGGIFAVPDPTKKNVLLRIGLKPCAGDTVLHITFIRKESENHENEP